MENNQEQPAPFTNKEQYQQYVESLGIDPELLASAAGSVIVARYSEWTPEGERYSSQEEIDSVIESLRRRQKWPEGPESGQAVMGRALVNKRRSLLVAEGIVLRPIWL